MSVYLHADNETNGEQVASSKGWGDVIAWSEQLPHEHYSELLHLIHYGWVEDLESLESEIKEASEFYIPEQEDVASTLDGLFNAIKSRPDKAEVMHLSNGMAEDDGCDEGEKEDSPIEKAIGDLANTPPDNEDVLKRNRRERALLLLLLGFWQAQEADILATIDPDAHQPITLKPQWNADLSAAILGGTVAVGFASAQESMRAIELPPERAREVNAIVHEELQTVADNFAALINQTTIDRVNAAMLGVTSGAENAGGLLRSAIGDVFDDAERTRGPKIAADNVFVAEQVGGLAPGEVANKPPADGVKPILTVTAEWFTADDDRVCPVCGPLDRRIVIAGDEFAPGINLPVVDTHPTCRCNIALGYKTPNYPTIGGTQ